MNGLLKKIKSGGPAAIITSAFIGPGSVIVATRVGVLYGYKLIWAVVFAVISLMVLMEMASRIAIVSKKDLIETTIELLPNNIIWKKFIQILMLISVLTVCFAFQTGNLTGGALGLSNILGLSNSIPVIVFMSIISLLVSVIGSSKLLELIMKLFVGFMGIIFVVTMIFIRPSLIEIFKGLVPIIPQGGFLLTLALIGTTLIGINIILHSITTKSKWNSIEDLSDSRWDIIINILIGGLITFSIVVISATVLKGNELKGNPALIFTQSLEPVLGSYAKIFGSLGLFAAGLSSAIAVPFTMKNITSKVFNFEKGIEDNKAKLLGTIVILFGAYLAIIGKSPQEIIILAQATSGLFLPIMTILTLLVANSKRLLGEYTNKNWQNLIGIVVVILTIILGIRGIQQAIEGLFKLIG